LEEFVEKERLIYARISYIKLKNIYMESKNIKKAVILLLCAITAFVIYTRLNNVSNETSNTNSNSSSSVEYPQLYKDADLPEYNLATLVDDGRQVTSIEDGIRLDLESDESVSTISAYYEKEMESLGWTIPTQKVPITTVYLSSYTKDGLTFQITITKLDENTDAKIVISYVKL
jgi:hypothetical protein